MGYRGLLFALAVGTFAALQIVHKTDAIACYSCDTAIGEQDCVKNSPGRNVSCPVSSVACFSLYNESIPSLVALQMRGCAPPNLAPESQAHVCKKPEFYHCHDAAPFALRASNLGSTDPVLCVCRGNNCNPGRRVEPSVIMALGPLLTAILAVFATSAFVSET